MMPYICDYCGKKFKDKSEDFGEEIGYCPIHKDCFFKKFPEKKEKYYNKKFTLDFGGHNPFLSAKKERDWVENYAKTNENVGGKNEKR